MKKVLVLLCTILCANMLMAQTRFWVGDLQYEVTSMTTVEVYDCNASATSVVIPSTVTYSGISLDVTSIGGLAFQNHGSLTSVTIPNSVTSIDGSAFRNCSSLTSIDIPNSVTSIGYCAFYDCRSLTSVTIGNSVTSIGDCAFQDCSSLTSVTIPNSVTSIGGQAFQDCSSLTSVTIGNSVTTIGARAFQDCSSLTYVLCLANTPPTIGIGAFYNAPNCNIYVTSASIENYENWSYNVGIVEGNLLYKFDSSHDNLIVNGCFGSPTAIEIPFSISNDSSSYSVISIRDTAFKNCSSLISVNIGNSVTSIGSSAFSGCSSLTSVNIGNSVTSIGWGAFSYCSDLTSVNIGNSVTSIEYYTFRNCSSLTSIEIPNSVTTIADQAFRNCSSLTSVLCLANTPPTIGYDAFYNTPSNKILYVNCGLRNYYVLYWGNCFNPDNIEEITFDIDTYVNNEIEGSIEIERNSCTSATLTATANNCYQFVSWNDGNIENPRIIELTNDTTFTAIFEELPNHNYNVNVSINNDSFGSVAIESDCNSSTLTATANNCYQFVSWNDGNTENPRVVNVSSDTSFTATFEEINFNTELSATICQGQVYTENGFNVSEAGVYTQTLTSANGCDSIVTLTLNVNPIFNTELSATICEGQVYNEQGFNVSEAGVYTQTLTSVSGCDSIVTLTLNVNPVFDTTINATINAGETYASFEFNETEAGTYVQNLQTVNGCDSTITLILDVNSSLMDVEETEISLYPNPTKSEITFSQAIEKVEVLNLTGKAILTFTNAKTINIESLPAGAYYLRLTNDEKTSLQKVIKQ